LIVNSSGGAGSGIQIAEDVAGVSQPLDELLDGSGRKQAPPWPGLEAPAHHLELSFSDLGQLAFLAVLSQEGQDKISDLFSTGLSGHDGASQTFLPTDRSVATSIRNDQL